MTSVKYPMYDCFSTDFKKPFGAVERLQECSFCIHIPKHQQVEEAALVMFRPGFKEKYIMLSKSGEDDAQCYYSCVYTPNDNGVHHYYFYVKINGNRLYIKRKDANLGDFNATELFQLTVYENGMTTPDWIKGGVMYQIFPDRFFRSGKNESAAPIDRTVHNVWNEIPDWKPNSKGEITNSDYFGGDLRGIEEKLDYLADIGISCIYLNPIFESHENHRYNTACYERVDSMLGKEEDFVRLCKKAKEKGISIILDGVFSHTGADSVYFNKFGRYGEHSGAFRDPNSPYREWYSFIKYPNEYESWWGIATLPNVNENTPSYTKYICGDGGILQKWIDLGAAGWRLDVADELPDEFLDNLNKAVKAKGDDKIIYGEVWEDASNKESYGVRRRYLIGGQLDSVMNYPFKECILNYVKFSDPKPFVDGVMTIIEHYPKPSVDVLMNFLSTHDTERAITRLAGEEVGVNNRQWQSEHSLSPQQYLYGAALLKCAMVLQFFLPGVPCVYYGDEAGQEGYKDPFNRRTYPWGEEDMDMIEFTRELSMLRKKHKIFADGSLKFIDVSPDYCVLARYNQLEAIVVVLNKNQRSKKFRITDLLRDFSFKSFEIVRSRSLAPREPGRIQVSPYDYAVLALKL